MKKILIVAMADSVHTARWIRQFDQDEIEFLLFPSTPHRRVHELISDHLMVTTKSSLRIAKWMTRFALPLGILDLIFKNRFRARLLGKELRSFQPDLIHIMETQHSGYLADRTLETLNNKPKVVLSLWGSDLFWFQKFKKHKSQIRSVLEKTDVLVTECKRDEDIARILGFKGTVIYGVPASGGFSQNEYTNSVSQTQPSQRKIIAIKGYSGFVGLGQMALKSLYGVSAELKDYLIVIYSADLKTRFSAEILKIRTGLKIDVRMKHSQTPQQMKELFQLSRVVVGVSKSDGLPATIKEAAFFGAFPVQTNTSCAGEWFRDGLSILLVSPQSINELESALRTALIDDNLVDTAATLNLEIAKNHLDKRAVRSKILAMYS